MNLENIGKIINCTHYVKNGEVTTINDVYLNCILKSMTKQLINNYSTIFIMLSV